MGLKQEFSVNIKIDTADESVNAAQAEISFNPDVLEVKSISKDDSIFNFWLQEPEFSNVDGTIEFIGGTPSGISGASLQILKINFVTKGVGASEFSFVDAAITAADGSGTNVLGNANGANFTISSTTAVPTAVPGGTPPPVAPAPIPTPVQIKRTPVKATGLPSAPTVKISLYPDPERWYNLISQFTVSWDLPFDISDLNTAINGNPNYAVPKKSEGLFDSKSFAALDEDGVYYFHIRFKNSRGWGPTAHYRIAIDTQPPLPFKVDVKTGLSSDDPSPVLAFKTGDALSGIGSYIIQVNNEEPVVIEPSSNNGSSEGTVIEESTELEIVSTGIGFLNVRDKPSISGAIITKVSPGENYTYTKEEDGWFKIVLTDGNEGWVFGKYVNLSEAKSEFISVSAFESEYKLKPHKPGIYMIKVKALDKAGNSVEDRVEVEILPIETPKITSITEKVILDTDDKLVIKGTAIASANVIVSIEDKDKFLVLQSEVVTNENGEWEFRLDRELRRGDYFATVQTKDSRGAVSFPTDPIKVTFKDKPVIVFFGLELTLKDLLIILVIAGIGAAGYFYRKTLLHIVKSQRESIIIGRDIKNAFNQIRSELDDFSSEIEKKRSFKEKDIEYKNFAKKVKQSLDKVEKYVSKDIERLK